MLAVYECLYISHGVRQVEPGLLSMQLDGLGFLCRVVQNALNLLGHNRREGNALMFEQNIELAIQSPQIHTLPTNNGSAASKDEDDKSDAHEVNELQTGK